MDRLTARVTSRFLSYAFPFLYLLTSIAFYLHTYDSAQVKITIVQMLGTTVIALWYTKTICEWDQRWKRFLPLMLPLIAVLLSGLISIAHTAYPGPSIDETLRRFFYIHFALIALTEINSLERVERLTKFLLIATAVATVYGLIQHLDHRFFRQTSNPTGIDPFVWRQAFGPRIFSTFGNPNFYGNFLVILTPVTLALLLKRHADRTGSVLAFAILSVFASAVLWQANHLFQVLGIPQWADTFFTLSLLACLFLSAFRFSFLGVLFFLITLCNILTESKGAWIGYVAGLLSFLALVFFYFSQLRSERVKKVIQRGALLVLTICVVGVGVYSRKRSDSLRFRICTWTSTFEMGLMHPIVGNGVGSFRVLYPAFRRPQIFHIEGKHNTETDHAENEYWEVFQDEGLIGFGLFLWTILTFSVLGARALGRFTAALAAKDPVTGKRKNQMDPRAFYMLGYLAAFWGMLIHNLMDVSLRFVSSGIFLWLLAGLIGAMVIHDPLPATDDQRDALEPLTDGEFRPHPMPVLFVARAISAVLFVAFAYYILAQFNDAQGPIEASRGDSLMWLISWGAFLFTVGGVLWGLFRTCRSLKQVYGFLILWLMVPCLHIGWGYFMADVHHNRGIAFSKNKQWDAAIKSYEKVVQLNPNYIMAYYFMGNVYTDRWQDGDFERAMGRYGDVWKIAPNYVQSHHQAGLVYFKRGQDHLRQAGELKQRGDHSAAAAAASAGRSDWEQALAYFHRYHGLDPVFESNYLRIIQVHLQMADLAKIEGRSADASKHYDQAELAAKESLGAWVCRSPENNVLREDWHRTHRHWNAEIFENLATTRYLRGDLNGAAKAFKMSLWVDNTNVRVTKNLAALTQRLGRPDETTRLWNRLRELAPQDADVQRVFHGITAPRP
jgi:tetratricopeptide (TPR) repeat protein